MKGKLHGLTAEPVLLGLLTSVLIERVKSLKKKGPLILDLFACNNTDMYALPYTFVTQIGFFSPSEPILVSQKTMNGNDWVWNQNNPKKIGYCISRIIISEACGKHRLGHLSFFCICKVWPGRVWGGHFYRIYDVWNDFLLTFDVTDSPRYKPTFLEESGFHQIGKMLYTSRTFVGLKILQKRNMYNQCRYHKPFYSQS